jgi:heptosyltransferase-2
MNYKNKTFMKILVIAPSWVGDMVMAQSLFITLKQQYPNCQIDVVAPSWTLALTQAMPEVSQGFVMSAKRGKLGLLERIKLGKSLRQYHYDQAILLPNTWKSALIPFFANIPKRTGYIGECRWGLLNDIRRLNKNVLTKTVQRFVALAAPSTINSLPICPTPVFKIKPDRQQQLIQQYHLPENQKILALCAGAEYGEAKRWPVSHYAQVARDKLNNGWQVWLFGSAKDQAVANEINQLTDNRCVDFSGKTSITEAVDLLSLANVVISNDSGLMHVASALNKNLIAIYGSSDPNFTPPLSDKAKILYLGLSCSPCFKRECPLGHTRCLTDITADHVIAQLNQLA